MHPTIAAAGSRGKSVAVPSGGASALRGSVADTRTSVIGTAMDRTGATNCKRSETVHPRRVPPGDSRPGFESQGIRMLRQLHLHGRATPREQRHPPDPTPVDVALDSDRRTRPRATRKVKPQGRQVPVQCPYRRPEGYSRRDVATLPRARMIDGALREVRSPPAARQTERTPAALPIGACVERLGSHRLC